MPPDQAEVVRQIRTGVLTEAEAMNLAVDVERRVKLALDRSPLPGRPNLRGVGKWTADMYSRHFALEDEGG